jgi:hypothetical protein
MIENIAAANSVNSGILLVTLQKVSSLLTSQVLPKTGQLNSAMGCGKTSTFAMQISCAAVTLKNSFNMPITYPYFFPVNSGEKTCYPNCNVVQSIQYSFGPNTCNKVSHPATCDLVGFWLADAATFAQYEYTPFVQTHSTGIFGGVRAFETLWFNYRFY